MSKAEKLEKSVLCFTIAVMTIWLLMMMGAAKSVELDRSKTLTSVADAHVIAELCPGWFIDHVAVDRRFVLVPDATLDGLHAALPDYITELRRMRLEQPRNLVCEMGKNVFGSGQSRLLIPR
jgi:hypothetical protein